MGHYGQDKPVEWNQCLHWGLGVCEFSATAFYNHATLASSLVIIKYITYSIAVYDVVEEKLESEPDFQYIPEKSPLDGIHQDDNALRESMFQLAEGLITGTVLAQFDVSIFFLHTDCAFFSSITKGL